MFLCHFPSVVYVLTLILRVVHTTESSVVTYSYKSHAAHYMLLSSWVEFQMQKYLHISGRHEAMFLQKLIKMAFYSCVCFFLINYRVLLYFSVFLF